MKQVRSQATTLSETTQTLTTMMLGRSNDRFTRLESHPASFNWRAPNLYFADVTDFMSCDAFEIGSDGEHWWWHSADKNGTNFENCPLNDVTELNISLCDPFGLTHRSPKEAAEKMSLRYLGSNGIFDRVAAWKMQRFAETIDATYTEWEIDTKNGLPSEVRDFFSGMISRTRFFYHSTPRKAKFKAPTLLGPLGAKVKPLENGYDHRFVDMSDGSNGTITLRWGQRGPKGTLGSGLN
jgi:hypothetical protein